MDSKKKIAKIRNIILHTFVILLSLASFIEAVVGFLPIRTEQELQAKVFFMGLTLIGVFYEITNQLLSTYSKSNNLLEMVKKGLVLSKDTKVESSVLLEIESDLNAAFGTQNGSFHIIIVTACLNPNEEAYTNAIWGNINNNYKYLYITPDDDQVFINSLINIFSKKGYSKKLTDVYEKVIHNISHLSQPDLFTILPDFFDLCLYCKDINGRVSLDGAKGFCCYQNELIPLDNRTVAFYYPLSVKGITNVFKRYSTEFDTERILQPYISPKIEQKNSSIHGQGLFCKPNAVIKKNEIIMIKGGYELHRSEMSSKLIDSYLPIGDDLFLAARNKEEELCVKLFINHSCTPNVGMLNAKTFIALRNIKSGEEITIDYAFVDNEEYSFTCHCGNPNCRQTITGFDWKRTELQKKYFRYFSPYLRDKIKNGKISLILQR